ncbi:Sin3 associated polypeptide p18-domain-containing protein [Mycena floridula]|nr:Sin3 associated polypeptide p18-domain-containing protein [Mycena floridula]
MDVDVPAGRENTPPFLIRLFLKINHFHRMTMFEEGTLPTGDEQQVYTWKDATLRELITTLRSSPSSLSLPELRHPLARFSFRTVYADGDKGGRWAWKDLGQVYGRDILGEPGSLSTVAPRLTQDEEREDDGEKTLADLRFVPGDFLCVAVLFPKNVNVGGGPPPERERDWPTSKGEGGWGSTAKPDRDGGWGDRGGAAGGHWRGGPGGLRRGRGGGRPERESRGDRGDRERDRTGDRKRSRSREPRGGGRGRRYS